MGNKKDGDETRRRILEVASRLFAEKGYRNTVLEEICRLAEANIGAVNYYFRSKENLYVEAWRQAFRQSLEKYPIDGGVPPDAPAEERLRGHILPFMRRMSDPENIEFDIMHKEMASPTGLLTVAMKESLEPVMKVMRSLVRELLGGDASENDVFFCEMSILGQCFNPIVMNMHRKEISSMDMKLMPSGLDLQSFDIGILAEHVVKFSLAGISEVRRRKGKAGRTSPKTPRKP